MSASQFSWYDFFAGGGLARLGIGDRWKCTFANDISEKKARAYRAQFGESPELKVADVDLLTIKDLPGTPDLVWASFPCQDLSLAGAGAGLKGKRSGTFNPFWRLVKGLIKDDRKPKVVVLENVVGAISSHRGTDFASLIRTICDAGYRVGPLVIDAVRFVPQSRPRLFMVALDNSCDPPAGVLGDHPSPPWHPPSLIKSRGTLPTPYSDCWNWWRLPVPPDRDATLSSFIEARPTGVKWHAASETRRLISLMSKLNKEKLESVRQEGIPRIGTVYKRTRPVRVGEHLKKVQRAEVRFDEISGCLRTPVGGSSRQIILFVHGQDTRSRLLSSVEAARLMGVPPTYPIPEKYSDAYHLFGDGLVVPAVAWLEKHLLRPLVLRKNFAQVA